MTAGLPRLVYLCSDPGVPPDGNKGSSVHFREMARALRAEGAELEVFMARRPEGGMVPPGLHLVPPESGLGMERELSLLAGSAAMLHEIRKESGFVGVYERFSLFGSAGLAYAEAHDLPLLLEVNAPLWEEATLFRSLHLPRTARALALEVMDGARRILVVSRELGRRLEAEGVEASKIEVMMNGVNGGLFEKAEPAPVPDPLRGRPILVFVGSMKPWHGCDFLLRALPLLERRGVGLWMVGDGPLGEEISRAADKHPRSLVHQGRLPHEEIPGILKAVDAVLAPYPGDAPSYFCPLKIVETLALGLPLVASRTPCVLDLVREEDGVELYEPDSPEDFLEAVGRALEKESVPGRIREGFTWKSKARRVLEILEASGPSSNPVMEGRE